MASPKTEEFTKKENEIAVLAKAISHPARVEILKELAKRNSCVCGEIVDVLPLAQSTVSQHLKELQKAGLISGTVEGARSCYCINQKKVEQFRDMLNSFLSKIDSNCC
ncbi:MAG: winged helix-turn-helix transcriptional regulator [Bacteroidia bacterium]|nr:metalloregulator ArsR/SmtB family transcription factor [Bacteroidia bacterium]NNM15386.1 winged helix-turn-helix transcriptional regulator [Bacteroidia bacterium]